METVLSTEKATCGVALASALGLLAQTAPADVIHFVPDPVVDSGFYFSPLVSWNPTALQSEAGDGATYPGAYSGAMYGCMGSLELSVGTPEGIEYMLTSTYVAPNLVLNDTVGSGHTLWSASTPGWAASLDLNGVTWTQPFYLGYRTLNGTDYNYGYAELVADYQGGDTRIMVNGWAYESTPNADITVAAMAIPEPGVLMLMLLGTAGLAVRRYFRRCE